MTITLPLYNRSYAQYGRYMKFAIMVADEKVKEGIRLASAGFTCKDALAKAFGVLTTDFKHEVVADTFVSKDVFKESLQHGLSILVSIEENYDGINLNKEKKTFLERIRLTNIFMNHLNNLYNLKQHSIKEISVIDNHKNITNKGFILTVDSWFAKTSAHFSMLLLLLRECCIEDFSNFDILEQDNLKGNSNLAPFIKKQLTEEDILGSAHVEEMCKKYPHGFLEVISNYYCIAQHKKQ